MSKSSYNHLLLKLLGEFLLNDIISNIIYKYDERYTIDFVCTFNDENVNYKNSELKKSNKFIMPIAITVDDNKIFVTDTKQKSIYTFDKNNYKFIKKIFMESYNINKLGNIAVDNNKLYVIDIMNHQIYVFCKKSYKMIKKIEQVGDYPIDVTIMDDDIYVTNNGIKSIIKINKLAYTKDALNYIDDSLGITIDKETENIYTTAHNDIIKLSYTISARSPCAPIIRIINKNCKIIQEIKITDKFEGVKYHGLAIYKNLLFVSDVFNTKINIYDKYTGEYLESITHDKLKRPYGITIDNNGYIYMTDPISQCVFVWRIRSL
jgi:DNA-binding beta-propeller fold protein YncE